MKKKEEGKKIHKSKKSSGAREKLEMGGRKMSMARQSKQNKKARKEELS